LRLHERGKNYVVDSYLLPPRKTGKITGKKPPGVAWTGKNGI